MAPWCKLVVLFFLVFTRFSRSQLDADQLIWSEDSAFEFGTAKPSLTETLLDIDTTKNVLAQYESNTHQKAVVLDNLLEPSLLMLIRAFLSVELGGWKFSLYEPYEGGKELPSDNIPWVNELDCIKFGSYNVSRILQKTVMDMSGSKDILYPYKVRGKILRRGDATTLYQDAEDGEDEYSLIVFLNERWQNNDYGEIYLYDKDREIFGGAVPKYGRVVLWQSSAPYLMRPPSMAFKKGLFLLHVQFTKYKDKVFKSHQQYEIARAQRIATVTGDFVGANKPAQVSANLNDKQVANLATKDGKKIFVFDNLFDKKDLDELRVVILKYGLYYYDDSEVEDSDNVQWIAGFSIDSYIKSRLWTITRKVASHVSGTNQWFPYDVSCNLIRNADHTRIHNDCSPEEDEWTFLIYLNPNMTRNDYGETVFYEADTTNPEIAAEVRPKYGRAVIFQGIIPHSARPPSTNFTHARLTFVAKLSVNEFVGRKKAFTEEMRHFSGVRYQQVSLENRAAGGDDQTQSIERPKSRKYSTDEVNQEDQPTEPEDDEGDPNERLQESLNSPEAPKPQQAQSFEQDEDDEEPEFDDQLIQSLEGRLREVEEDPKRPIESLRALHRELTASHALNRDILRKSLEMVL